MASMPSLANKSLLRNPPDFQDALLYAIALLHPLDFLITSNKRDFKPIQNMLLPQINATGINKILISEK